MLVAKFRFLSVPTNALLYLLTLTSETSSYSVQNTLHANAAAMA
jgi:hypothetical protein